jgi:hypothetical protein
MPMLGVHETFERTCLLVALFAKKQQKVRQKRKLLNLALRNSENRGLING